MNKEFYKIILRRFGKGLLSAVGAFTLVFLLEQIPLFVQLLPSVINDKMLLAVMTALLLALEKALQGYRPK